MAPGMCGWPWNILLLGLVFLVGSAIGGPIIFLLIFFLVIFVFFFFLLFSDNLFFLHLFLLLWRGSSFSPVTEFLRWQANELHKKVAE